MKSKDLSEDDLKAWEEFSKEIKKIPEMDYKNTISKNNFTKTLIYNPEVEKKESPIKPKKQKTGYHNLSEQAIDKKKLRNLKRGKIRRASRSPSQVFGFYGKSERWCLLWDRPEGAAMPVTGSLTIECAALLRFFVCLG